MQKQNSNVRNETTEIANVYFSHYKSLKTESCHNNQSSYLTGTKKNKKKQKKKKKKKKKTISL